MSLDKENIGHFLNYELWKDGLRLLNTQIAAQESNKHFKTLSMIYYKNLGDSVKQLGDEAYFNNFVSNNLFYGLENEFAVYPYTRPKTGLGLRNYNFLTYPMRVLYDSVGLYMLRMSQEFLANYYRSCNNIRSFYGGNLEYKGQKLEITKDNIYFREYYKQFRREIEAQAERDIDRKIIIKLDIQNYFDEISIPILLEHFETHYKDSIKKKHNFDTITKEQIEFLFGFLRNNQRGILQADNSIISSVIGHLYLVFFDLLIDGEIAKDEEKVEEYRIIRFVDDIHIAILFREGIETDQRAKYIETLVERASDILYSQFNLRLNQKSRFFLLSSPEDLHDLKISLKAVSLEYYFDPDEHDDSDISPNGDISLDDLSELDNLVIEFPSPEQESISDIHRQANEVLDELKQLNALELNATTFGYNITSDKFNEIYNKHVFALFKSEDYQKRIQELFNDFDFSRVKEYPQPIIVLILSNETARESFRSYLLKHPVLTSQDANLVLTYLCQVDFGDEEMMALLQNYTPMKEIISRVENPNLSHERPGYFSLPEDEIRRLVAFDSVIEQVRLRALNERAELYSVALNHLLNEIHAVCFNLDKNEKRNKRDGHGYGANQVDSFLLEQGVPHKSRVGVRNLFDRRNANPVSHPSSGTSLAWGVSKSEYYKYRRVVSNCLQALSRAAHTEQAG